MNNKPVKLYLFYCANSIDTDALRQSGSEMGTDELTAISLPCSGKVNLLYLLKAFEKGAHGVLLSTCSKGTCSFLEGNLRARKRAEAVDALLEETGLDRGRMRVIANSDGDIKQIVEELKDMSASIRKSL